jgi:hypothetical protein
MAKDAKVVWAGLVADAYGGQRPEEVAPKVRKLLLSDADGDEWTFERLEDGEWWCKGMRVSVVTPEA